MRPRAQDTASTRTRSLGGPGLSRTEAAPVGEGALAPGASGAEVALKSFMASTPPGATLAMLVGDLGADSTILRDPSRLAGSQPSGYGWFGGGGGGETRIADAACFGQPLERAKEVEAPTEAMTFAEDNAKEVIVGMMNKFELDGELVNFRGMLHVTRSFYEEASISPRVIPAFGS